MEIARQAQLDKSTTSRLLKTLQDLQYIDRDEKSKAYGVGAGFLALATSAIKYSRMLRLANPHLKRLTAATGESTGFYLRVGTGRICADGVEGEHAAVPFLPRGEPISLLVGASSFVILAFQPEPFRRDLYKEESLKKAEVNELESELALVRQQGYCMGKMQRLPSVATLSAPISQNGQVIGAVTILGQAHRQTHETLMTHVPLLLEACTSLSLALSGSDYEKVAPQSLTIDVGDLG